MGSFFVAYLNDFVFLGYEKGVFDLPSTLFQGESATLQRLVVALS